MPAPYSHKGFDCPHTTARTARTARTYEGTLRAR